MKNSLLQLRKRWIVCNHGNQLPPEPVLNLFSYDNSPWPTALVRQPVHSGCLLLKVSQQGTGSVQTSEGDQSVSFPKSLPCRWYHPTAESETHLPWTSDVPQTLCKCNSLFCLERRCWTSLDLFQTLSEGLVILWWMRCENDTNHMKLMIFTSLWSIKMEILLGEPLTETAPSWSNTIVTTCMSYFIIGDPSKECRTNITNQKNTGRSKCPTNLPESSLLASILAEWCARHQEGPWVRMMGQRKPGN